ncbi:hypothetical protein H6G89_10795 [Oscillatoria sp. FACHB-1407]|uniref:hypothetical protein n=1 Tax=Oscillatoria sp. FACHB-1407 TaxID=2692847 RepID=UPI001686197D|nr:hypothetical protein [Oscillatoria sp. FACHB-1407]MBD2461537.1 hypothetical protein [Oscillatoria sp. FACHB-1407]
MNSWLLEPGLPLRAIENPGFRRTDAGRFCSSSCGFNRQNPDPEFTLLRKWHLNRFMLLESRMALTVKRNAGSISFYNITCVRTGDE